MTHTNPSDASLLCPHHDSEPRGKTDWVLPQVLDMALRAEFEQNMVVFRFPDKRDAQAFGKALGMAFDPRGALKALDNTTRLQGWARRKLQQLQEVLIN